MSLKSTLLPAALVLLTSTLALGLLASTASAAEPQDLIATSPSSAGDAVSCPPLTRVKYPFLRCRTNAWGGTQLDSSGVRTEGVSPAVRYLEWAWKD